MASPDVTILGGGVSGLTTGVVCNLLGYDTRIYTADRPFHGDTDPPELASAYAAASVKPTSISVPAGLNHILRISQDIFTRFWRTGAYGVRRQPHFEVHETPQSNPAYATTVTNFRRLADLEDSNIPVPRRNGDCDVYGWLFDAYFVEMPVYMERLADLYTATGGTIIETEVTREMLSTFDTSVVVNCTGYGSRDLFPDEQSLCAVRGHLVHVDAPETVRPTTDDGQWFSYNYHPDPDALPDDLAGEVYCYPRTDTIVLGGSRQRGHPDSDGGWVGERTTGATCDIDGIEVPERILETNRTILNRLTGAAGDLDVYDLSARIGYRPVRNSGGGGGVRIERTSVDGVDVVHNYGHGGSGVTLSWGCAARAVALVDGVLDDSIQVSSDTDWSDSVTQSWPSIAVHLRRVLAAAVHELQ